MQIVSMSCRIVPLNWFIAEIDIKRVWKLLTKNNIKWQASYEIAPYTSFCHFSIKNFKFRFRNYQEGIQNVILDNFDGNTLVATSQLLKRCLKADSSN